MKVKLLHTTLNIWLWLTIWCLITFIIYSAEHFYYNYASVDNFIKFEKLDFQDINKDDEFQLLYSYRDSKINTIADFYFKIYCNWIIDPNWAFQFNDIILEVTNWLKKIDVKFPANPDLDIWTCTIESDVHIKIHDNIIRTIQLTDSFNVKK
jgi:hypothetical protein